MEHDADSFDGVPWPLSEDDYGDRVASPDRQSGTSTAPVLRATPFVWTDPGAIAPRPWVYGRRLCRGFVSATIAPGGVGKSTIAVVDALALASGRSLVGESPHAPARVWYWSGEDPIDEAQRRIAAAALHHSVHPDDLEARLFVDSGRDVPIRLAEADRTGAKLSSSTIDAIERIIRRHSIDVVILDPFVQLHGVSENDNTAIDAVVKALAGIAGRQNCAIEIVHHARKLNGGEADADSARGGSAIIAAVRSARVLNPLGVDAARTFGISDSERRRYVRIDDAKANLAPTGSARWVRIESVPLGNHTEDRPEDFVGVVESWSPPNPLDAIGPQDLGRVQAVMIQEQRRNVRFGESSQAADWVGHLIADVVGIDSHSDQGRSQLKKIIQTWISSGALMVERDVDKKGRERPFVVPGDPASTP